MSKLLTQVKELDKQWKERIKDNWWATNYAGNINDILSEGLSKNKGIEKLLKLRDRLIEIGGEECCLPFGDEDIDKILEKGELLIPEPINNEQKKYWVEYYEMIGAPSQCHRNSAALYEINKDNTKLEHKVRICTGYAITDDGMWRQHTWLVYIDETNDNEVITVIETTLKRVAYYGVVLTEEQCEEFCSWYDYAGGNM